MFICLTITSYSPSFGVVKARIQAACQLISMVQSKEKMNPFLSHLSATFSFLTLLWTLSVGNGGALQGLGLRMSINDQDSSPQTSPEIILYQNISNPTASLSYLILSTAA